MFNCCPHKWSSHTAECPLCEKDRIYTSATITTSEQFDERREIIAQLEAKITELKTKCNELYNSNLIKDAKLARYEKALKEIMKDSTGLRELSLTFKNIVVDSQQATVKTEVKDDEAW